MNGDDPAHGREPARREPVMVALLCLLAAIRVLVGCVAFPVFNPVDEAAHFDYVWKCARGRIPLGIETYDRQAAERVVLFDTPEYLEPPSAFGGSFPPPRWTRPTTPANLSAFRAAVDDRASRPAHEGVQPPLYYLLAGAWLRAGEWMGIRGGKSPYWIRLFNVPVVVLTVLAAWWIARRLWPGRAVLRLSVPLLVAVFPQDLQYSISNGVLSPLIGALAAYWILRVAIDENPSRAVFLGAGLASGAAFLTMYTNLPVILALVAALSARAPVRRGAPSVSPSGWILALGSCGGVAGAWLVRNLVRLGAPTAMGQYLSHYGWTGRTPGEVLAHPIFRPRGLLEFWRGLMGTFFNGELTWHGSKISLPGIEPLHASLAALFLLGAVWSLRRPLGGPRSREATLVFLVWVLGSVGMLAAMSARYHYGDWPASPSRGYPYFAVGRMISGCLVPFLILYVDGLSRIASRLGGPRAVRAGLALVALLLSLAAVHEILVVLPSAYNGFHLADGGPWTQDL